MVDALSEIEVIFYSLFTEIFYHEWILNFVKIFFCVLGCSYGFSILLIRQIIFIDFQM